MSWERTSENVVLDALFLAHPEQREFIVIEERFPDPEDFSFIWQGTLDVLKKKGLVIEPAKTRRTMFRPFKLTAKGLKAAKKQVLSP